MSETKITVTKNAPYKIEGDFTVEHHTEEGVPIGGVVVLNSGKPTYLCSCGLSGKKPYCDGSHTKK